MKLGDLFDHRNHERFRILALCSRTGEAVLEHTTTNRRELAKVADLVPEKGWTAVAPPFQWKAGQNAALLEESARLADPAFDPRGSYTCAKCGQPCGQYGHGC